MPVDSDLRAFVAGGVAIVMATADEGMRPQVARAWGPRIGDDDETLTVCFEAPAGSPTRANLERGGTVAITFSQPSTYRTVQIKGPSTELRDPGEDDLAAVGEHVEAFSREAATVGLPPAAGPRFLHPELVAMTMAIREVYDQTPGPGAGRKL